MKMKKYSLLFAAIMALVCSCSSDDDTPNPSNGQAEGNFTGIIFATAITNPEGSSGSSYMQAIAGMIPGSYDNRNAIHSLRLWCHAHRYLIGQHLHFPRLYGQLEGADRALYRRYPG